MNFFKYGKKKKKPPKDSSHPSDDFIKRREAAKRELRSKTQKHLFRPFYNIYISVLAFIIRFILGFLYYSCRIKKFEIDSETKKLLENANSQFIIALWHSRLQLLPYFIYRNIIRGGHDLLGLISPSLDGELTTRIVVSWGAYIVRGSSSKKGVSAMKEILAYLKLHFNPMIAVDGPRGPRYKLKKGAAFLARASSLPVIPCCYAAKKEWYFYRAWDRGAIPKPFSPVVLEYGKPIYIKKDMDTEEARLLIEEKMNEQMQRLEAFFGKPFTP